MQPQRRDVYGTVLDSSLVALCAAYAHWLDGHKDMEPDQTWLEVAAGVALCLAQAELSHRWAGLPYRLAVWRAFFLGAAPIVVGELNQAWRAEKKRKGWKPPQPRKRPDYSGLTQ
jgi:hypothetical protein